ncbi:MAG: hypothetical protein AAGC86_11920 [Pseudomonadota bacterium]
MGAHQSTVEAKAEAAGYEARWWRTAGAVRVAGGDVSITLDADKRVGIAEMSLRQVHSDNGRLDLDLPHGVSLVAAQVQGEPIGFETAYGNAAVAHTPCPAQGCSAVLDLRIDRRVWPDDLRQSWIDGSGLWLRVEDVVPVLGLDPERLLYSPVDRAAFALPPSPPGLPPQAFRAAGAVAPKGDWTWTMSLHSAGEVHRFAGATKGPLDFAAVWSPGQDPGASVIHGPARAFQATEISDDVDETSACLQPRLCGAFPVRKIVQAPRNLGPTALHGTVLWMPENEGWDSAGTDPGRAARRHRLAHAMARQRLSELGDLPRRPGSQMIRDGFSD